MSIYGSELYHGVGLFLDPNKEKFPSVDINIFSPFVVIIIYILGPDV